MTTGMPGLVQPYAAMQPVYAAPALSLEEQQIQAMEQQIETMQLDKEVHQNKIVLEQARLALRQFEYTAAKKKCGIETVKPEIIDTADVPLPPLYDFKVLKPKNAPGKSAKSEGDKPKDKPKDK